MFPTAASIVFLIYCIIAYIIKLFLVSFVFDFHFTVLLDIVQPCADRYLSGSHPAPQSLIVHKGSHGVELVDLASLNIWNNDSGQS